MTNLDSIFNSRGITLPTKVHLVKAMIFPVVMYGRGSWTVKKAECQRTDAFEVWCWRRLLRVPWTARRSNQSILKETSPGCSWKDWCWGWNSNIWPPHVKSWLIGKDSDAGRDWGQKEKETTEDEMVGWHHRLNGCEYEWTPRVGVFDREVWRAAIHGVTKSWTRLCSWTELNWILWYTLHVLGKKKKQWPLNNTLSSKY